MTLAQEYKARGYYTHDTADQVRADIATMQSEIERADKRTQNGKRVRAYNDAIIAIARIVLSEAEVKQ